MKDIDAQGRPTAEAPWPPAETRAAPGRIDRQMIEAGALPPPTQTCERTSGGFLPEVVDRSTALSVLDQYQSHSWQTGILFSVLLVAVDGLDAHVHRFGREAVDETLTRLGDLLRASVRRNDLVARWGEDEFLVGLRGANPETAGIVAERLRLNPAVAEGVCAPVTISIGVATWRSDVPDIHQMIDEAESGLRRAKQQGGNRVCSNLTAEAA